jgi:hypothetical protein
MPGLLTVDITSLFYIPLVAPGPSTQTPDAQIKMLCREYRGLVRLCDLAYGSNWHPQVTGPRSEQIARACQRGAAQDLTVFTC